jgi:hypothetical protein
MIQKLTNCIVSSSSILLQKEEDKNIIQTLKDEIEYLKKMVDKFLEK